MGPLSESDLQAVLEAVSASKKYGGVCPDTVRRIAARELAARRSVKDAVKATKRRLHQVYGAFEQALDAEAAFGELAKAWGGGCLLYTSPSPRDRTRSRMPSSA